MDRINEIHNQSGTCDDVMFPANPIFFFKEKIIEKKAACIGYNCDFEVYYSKEENKMYVFIGDIHSNDISMISLPENKVVRNLKGHQNLIINIRYFSDVSKEKEYLVSSDYDKKVIVWDIKNDFKLICTITTEFKGYIYSCLMLVKNNANLLIISNVDESAQTKVYDFQKNVQVSTIPGKQIFYLIYWYNMKDNNDYVIQCGKGEVSIINLLSGGSYASFSPENKNHIVFGGVLFSKEDSPNKIVDFLLTIGSQGCINIYNLDSKKLVKNIKLNDAHLCNVLRWNEKFMIILNSFGKLLEVINLDTYEVQSEVCCPEFDREEKFIKKVIHPIYGECLISISPRNTLKLLSNRDMFLH